MDSMYILVLPAVYFINSISKNWFHFFSVPGTTAKIAEKLAEAIGADIFDVEPDVPYANVYLNWMDKKARSMVEMTDQNYRLAIAEKLDNMAE